MPTKSPLEPVLSNNTYLTYDDVLLLPAYSEVTPPEISIETSLLSLKVPIIASPMDTICEKEMALALSKLGALGIIHRNLSIQQQAQQLEWVIKQGGYAACALGIGPDFNERAAFLVKKRVMSLCIDAAHGHTKQVIEKTTYLKEKYPNLPIIAGNVVTYEGALALFDAGADVVKVGVGPGSICTTRLVSGVGAPQLTAVMQCAQAAKEKGKEIIADGGIKAGGDIVKAFAAGASAVMLGSLLAGTDETPSNFCSHNQKKYKTYRGMGSAKAMKQGSATRYGLKLSDPKAPQGIEGRVPYKGPVSDQIHLLVEGLRAGMAYVGAKNLLELPQKARFIRQTKAGLFESHPHSVEKL